MMMDFFSPLEFACGCGRPDCDAAPMDMSFVFKLNELRLRFGQAMRLTSARRCRFWNTQKGGELDSKHLEGRAVDVHCADGIYMRDLVRLALGQGFRIGIKARMVHLDNSAPQVMWGYPSLNGQ